MLLGYYLSEKAAKERMDWLNSKYVSNQMYGITFRIRKMYQPIESSVSKPSTGSGSPSTPLSSYRAPAANDTD
jgi:hypothetical protein